MIVRMYVSFLFRHPLSTTQREVINVVLVTFKIPIEECNVCLFVILSSTDYFFHFCARASCPYSHAPSSSL